MMKIVVDAGHGFETEGKRTPDGMREYEFNREVARIAKAELQQYKNVEVYFTHADERDVPLSIRTDRANQLKADVFVSIHANAFGSGGWNQASGIETYVHPTASAKNVELAKAVQKRLVTLTGRRDRGIKTANFHVLRETTMPTLLTECGFMTNQEEATLLQTSAYRKKCAQAIVSGLVTFYKLMKKTSNANEQGLYKVQIGAFSKKENAEKLAEVLEKDGYSTFIHFKS
ncbi:N-acetylmuramoyl-L-alanine amidase [Bacillus seohaeanensis]|uniref:N-acetylmuramoyl-L-alanine amidase n=1 Tax=Bacillus seohaeanensis TaxID=284580 RepID=A0ABW5RL27_9BACI